MVYVPFGEWKPDSGFLGSDKLEEAKGVYAGTESYSPLKKMMPFSEALPNKATGSASFVDKDGNIITVAGDINGLYVSRGFGWEDISKDGGYNGTSEVWRFVLWGDYILATNYADPIQAWQIGSVGTFKDMSATAPRCKDMAVVNEFLVLVNTVDSYDAERPNRIWWSPIADPFGEWKPSQTTLCDFQEINTGSYCIGIAGGSYGIILMRDAFIRLNFIGSPLAFSLETVQTDRGCINIQAFCLDGDSIYYVAQDGFFWFNGSSSVSLGAGKVDKWFFDNSEIVSTNLVISAIDIIDRCVYFGYPSKGQYEVTDRVLIYSIIGQKWTHDDNDIMVFTNFLSKGYNLEELDEVSEQIDNLPFSLDSNYYKGGVPYLGGFGLDNKLYFEGEEDRDGTITTGDIALMSNEIRATTDRVRPLIEGDGVVTMSISAKQSVSDIDKFGRICNINSIGDFTERKSGRYHKLRFSFSGKFTKLRGFDISIKEEGSK